MTLAIIAGAFVFERFFDQGVDNLFESLNQGVSSVLVSVGYFNLIYFKIIELNFQVYSNFKFKINTEFFFRNCSST